MNADELTAAQFLEKARAHCISARYACAKAQEQRPDLGPDFFRVARHLSGQCEELRQLLVLVEHDHRQDLFDDGQQELRL